jgi:hypothetical protein
LRSALLRSTALNPVDHLEHLISKVNWVNFEINSVLPSLLLVFVEKVLTCLFTPPLGNFHSRPHLFGVGSEPCCGSIFLALMASVPPPTPPPAAKRSVATRPPHGRRSRRAQVRRTRSAPCAASHRRPRRSVVVRGVVQDVIRRGGGDHVLPAPWHGWSCRHPRRRTGARASLPWRTH